MHFWSLKSANIFRQISSVILSVIVTAPAKNKWASPLFSLTLTLHAFIINAFPNFYTVPLNDILRCGCFSYATTHFVRVEAVPPMPQRVLVVSKEPQHAISRCGCLSNATTRCGRFFRSISIFDLCAKHIHYVSRLLKMIAGVLTTSHTQYTSDRSM
jgi:hypothetical protein